LFVLSREMICAQLSTFGLSCWFYPHIIEVNEFNEAIVT
jgi:hypothetical protein